jgi:hypothetical protein
MFEFLSPGRQFTEPADFCKGTVKPSVVIWGQLIHENPGKQIEAGLVKVMKEVVLDAAPTIYLPVSL